MKDQPSQQEKRGPIAWMAGNSVAANLIMLVCLIGGFLALRNMKQEVFPDIQFDVVEVSVAYPGATPEDVEEGIILPIEQAVEDLEGIDEISSTAHEGYGVVSIKLQEGVDAEKLTQDIKSEIDRITSFPEDAEEPQVRLLSRKREVLTVALYGDVDRVVLHELAEQVRDQFIQDPDITQVDISGLPPLEIAVEISQENLRRYGLTLDEVANRIRKNSLDLPAGGLKTKSGEILIRIKERRDYGRQFAQLPIITTA
ncbi:MAG: efflux RND transporter permease subunit, partial [Planctomycetes bacterium]|nr:efflux RND transporter permease subunit [Planctomycetota bacterium]